MRPRTFWQVLKNSLTSPNYYLKLLTLPFGFSFRFFLISMIALGLSLSLRVNQRLIPLYQQDINQGLIIAQQNFPEDLEITWRENELISSTDDSLLIPYPESMGINDQFPPILGQFIPEEITIEEISEKISQESLFIVSRNKLFVNNFQGIWTETKLNNFFPEEEIILNKKSAPKFIEQFRFELDQIFILVKQVNYLIFPLGMILIKLWIGLLEGILIFLFFKLNRFKINFKRTFQFSLHIVVISEMINQIAGWVYPSLSFPLFTFSYWCLFSYIFWTQRNNFVKIST